jgi:hypothetical protein
MWAWYIGGLSFAGLVVWLLYRRLRGGPKEIPVPRARGGYDAVIALKEPNKDLEQRILKLADQMGGRAKYSWFIPPQDPPPGRYLQFWFTTEAQALRFTEELDALGQGTSPPRQLEEPSASVNKTIPSETDPSRTISKSIEPIRPRSRPLPPMVRHKVGPTRQLPWVASHKGRWGD